MSWDQEHALSQYLADLRTLVKLKSHEELIPWMAYLQLAHFKGAFSLGRPNRSHEGFEHVMNVLLTVSGSPDMRVRLPPLLIATTRRHPSSLMSSKPVLVPPCPSPWRFDFVRWLLRFAVHSRTVHSLRPYLR